MSKTLEVISIGSILLCLCFAYTKNAWLLSGLILISVVTFILNSFMYPDESGFGSDEYLDEEDE